LLVFVRGRDTVCASDVYSLRTLRLHVLCLRLCAGLLR
jgi:hypothetical protein